MLFKKIILKYIFGISCWAILNMAASAAPPPEVFGELPKIYDASISPDGTRVALFLNIKGTYGVGILAIDDSGEKPKSILLGEGVKPEWVKWANNNRVLVSLWQSQKYDGIPVTSGAIYTIDAKTMKGKYLVKAPRGMVRQFNNNVIDFLDDDPDHILMSFSNTDTFAPDIQLVDVVKGKSKRLKKGNRKYQNWYTDRRGEPRIGQGLSDSSTKERKWNLTIRDAEGNKWRSAEEYPGLSKGIDIFGFTADPNELIVGRRMKKDTKGLYIYNLAEKKMTRKLFHNDDYDVSNIVLSSDGKDVIGVTYQADVTETELFEDYSSSMDRLRAKMKDYVIDFVDQSQDGRTVLLKMSNSYDPGALMMFDTETEDLSSLSKLRPGLSYNETGTVSGLHYKARDGFHIPAYVTVPPSITDANQLKNIPFIVLPHGGPYARDTKRFDYLAQFFATRGYGVLQMNFRGSKGYGKSFEDAGRKNWVLMQEDVEDGARWLVEKGYADPERLCIAGWSYGGYAALMGAIKNPDLYACSISMAGVTDLRDMISDMKQYRFGKLSARNFILKGFEDKDAIKENSPVKRAEEFTVPLFLAHGELDQRVHFDQYKRMKRALKKSPAKTTFMEFEDEDHFLSSQANRQKFFKGLDKFLNETLGESEFKVK